MLDVEYTIFNGQIVGEATPTSQHDYLLDPLGSVIGKLDSSQNISEPREFWPYGQQASGTAPAIGALTFVGSQGYMVDHAGFYVRMRIFSDILGVWKSLDPLWPTYQAYTYCFNDPTMIIDPSGANPVCIGCAACLGLSVLGLLLSCLGSSNVISCIMCRLATNPGLIALLAVCAVVCALLFVRYVWVHG